MSKSPEGKYSCQGKTSIRDIPSAIKVPKELWGGEMPKPKKLKNASMKIALGSVYMRTGRTKGHRFFNRCVKNR